MIQRLCFVATLAGVLLLAPAALAGDGTKKVQAAVAKLNAIKPEDQVSDSDARLAEAAQAIEAARLQNDADGAKALLGLLTTPFPNATVEVFVTEQAQAALIALQPGPGRDEVRAQMEKNKRNPAVVVPLVDVVAGWNEPASAQALGDLLTQKAEVLVLAGARGLAKLKRKECVPPLIAAFGALQETGGEPLEAVGNALYDLTKQGFRTPADWSKWWQTAEATFDPNAKAHNAAGATRVRSFQPDDTPALFETEIKSKKVVIVLDVSGSMHIRQFVQDPPPKEVPPPARRRPGDEGTSERERPGGSQTGDDKEKGGGGGAGGGGAGAGGGGGGGGGNAAPVDPENQPPPLPPNVNPDDPKYKPKKCVFGQCPGAKGTGPACPSDENLPMWYRRHNRLMRQVKAVIRSFRPDAKFNLVAFSSDARPFKGGGKLLEASDKNKRDALKWIDALQPQGATLADKAIELAFSFTEADTIIFVTDGAPTNASGRPYDSSRWRELLNEVKRLNKVRRVKIEVFAIAEGHTEFARGLASESGGEYVTVP